MFKKALLLLGLALPIAVHANTLPQTDAEKIADALKGGPEYIAAGARVLDWPSAPGGAFRELRKGSTEWTCLPTSPHHHPVCSDPTFLQFFQDAVAHRPEHVDRVGIAYMYEGDMVVPQAGDAPTHPYHVEPHIMLVVPGGAGLTSYSTDGSTGKAYINRVPGDAMPYLVIPIHETPSSK